MFPLKLMAYEHGASQVSGATTVLLEKAGDITSSIFKGRKSEQHSVPFREALFTGLVCHTLSLRVVRSFLSPANLSSVFFCVLGMHLRGSGK